jgi:hypothetical protein
MFEFIRDFISRHTKYVSGIPPLQAFFRLVNRGQSFNIDKLVVVRALAFLRFLSTPYKRQAPELMIERPQPLGFAPERFEEQFFQAFFPGTDFRQLGFENSIGSI